MSFVWWPIKQFTNNNNNNLVTFLNRMLSWDRLFSMDSFPPLSPIAPGFNPMQTIYSFSWFIWLILIFAIEVYYNYGVSMVYSGSFNHLRSESGFPGFPPKNVKMSLFTWQEQRRALLNHSLQQAQTSTSICWSSSSISTGSTWQSMGSYGSNSSFRKALICVVNSELDPLSFVISSWANWYFSSVKGKRRFQPLELLEMLLLI